jgi:hypothetical protein
MVQQQMAMVLQKGGSTMENSKYNQFMTANTIEMDLDTMKVDHLVPVHVKDNEPCVSHHEFIESVAESGEAILGTPGELLIRVSHPIKGRIASAKHKPAAELLPEETTLYYERMAWTLTFPEHQFQVGDDWLSLTIGGVKAFNQDNLYSSKSTLESFKMFIGFQNKVCTNLCVATDGIATQVKANSVSMLVEQAKSLFMGYALESSIDTFNRFSETSISESEFAHIIGRAKMFTSMKPSQRKEIPDLGLTDSQLSTVVEDYFLDEHHRGQIDGSIDLWSMYNLFTGANKSSYIDTILDRNVNIYQGVKQLAASLEHKQDSWYLN